MARVYIYNKEEKRVSNVLYALWKMFLESLAPGIQTLINENVQFKYFIVGVALSARYRVKTPEEYNIERAFE